MSIGLVNKAAEQPAIGPAQACIAIIGIWMLNGALFNIFAMFSGGREAKTNMTCHHKQSNSYLSTDKLMCNMVLQ